MRKIFRSLAALSLVVALCAARPALALDTGDIVVASIKGEVHIAVRGTDTRLRVGAALELPATVRTGPDGAIELRQGATSISVGPETLLEFPALATPGGSIDRIVQPRGTAFYNVGKRSGRKLRIETPFLVGVVKGTQFSVVAQDHATNISLFEGLLEIRSADDSDVIDLHAGEIAMRDRVATDISVLKMEAGAPPPLQKAPDTKPLAPNSPAGAGGSPATPSSRPRRPSGNVAGEPIFAGRDHRSKPAESPVEPIPARAETPSSDVVPGVDTIVDTPLFTGDVNVDLGGAAVVDTTDNAIVADSGLGQGTGAPATVDPGNGAATVDLGANANGSSVSVEVGGGDIGLGTEVDLGLDDEGKDNSGPGNNSGHGNGRDDNSGNGNSGPGNSNDVAAIVETTDLAVEADTGSPPAAAVVGANLSVNDGVSVEASVALDDTQVDLGADLGAVTDIDLGLDEEEKDNSGPGNNSGNGNSGSGNGNSGRGSDNSGPGNAVDGLLDGLTRRSGKK